MNDVMRLEIRAEFARLARHELEAASALAFEAACIATFREQDKRREDRRTPAQRSAKNAVTNAMQRALVLARSPLTTQQRRMASRYRKLGASVHEIGRRIGASPFVVSAFLKSSQRRTSKSPQSTPLHMERGNHV